jgi:hypothetical protein
MGLSWFGVLPTASFLSEVIYSHAQPLPKRVLAALLKVSLNLSNEPNSMDNAVDRSADGPADFAARLFQKIHDLNPPPLF